MSKHQNTIKRQRCERSRAFRRTTNRGQRITCAVALAAAAAIAGATSAYAEQIRFDNPAHGDPGHFHWPGEFPENSNFLDLTKAASNNPTEEGSGRVRANILSWGSRVEHPGQDFPGTTGLLVDSLSGLRWLTAVAAGEVIPPEDALWTNDELSNAISYHEGESTLPEGKAAYLGLRFDLGSGWQHAWIGVVRSGPVLETFAWGYETEPGVPIPAGAGSKPTCESNADCDDEDICTEDLCDPANSECSNEPIVCDDGDACTIDSCNPASGCDTAPVDCDDADVCTADECVDGVCFNDAIVCDDGDPCTVDDCNQVSGCTTEESGESTPGISSSRVMALTCS